MENEQKHIVIVAGEASGDMHAASLVREIRSLNPRVTFAGLGGENMKQAGVDIYLDVTALAVVGFVEVIKNLTEIRKAFKLIVKRITDTKPDCVILVDYPGFNLRLARVLHQQGIRVIYYISPQVWAWKENRIRLLRKYTNTIIVFFEFEKELYKKLCV